MEVEYMEEIETKENELKEMLTKKKLAKSKKNKLELVRESMKILENVSEKATFEDDPAIEIKKLILFAKFSSL